MLCNDYALWEDMPLRGGRGICSAGVLGIGIKELPM
jgi:hypothetical protein